MIRIKVIDESVSYRVKLWWSKADRAGIYGAAEWEVVDDTINLTEGEKVWQE